MKHYITGGYKAKAIHRNFVPSHPRCLNLSRVPLPHTKDCILEAFNVVHPSVLQPNISLDKLCYGEFAGFCCTCDHTVTRPIHSLAGSSTCSTVHVLSIIQCLQKVLTLGIPLCPSCWINMAVYRRLHHNSSRILLPWSTQISFDGTRNRLQIRTWYYVTLLNRSSCVLVWIFSSLGCHHVLLVTHGFSSRQVALLKHNGCVSEYEINGASHKGVSVKLSVGVGIESVLVSINPASVYDRSIRTYSKSHCLVLLWTCTVLEPYVLTYKSIPHSSCKTMLPQLVTFDSYKYWKITE